MRGQQLVVPVDGGELGGWVTGDGPGVLLTHGGPGLSYEVMDDLADVVLRGRIGDVLPALVAAT